MTLLSTTGPNYWPSPRSRQNSYKASQLKGGGGGGDWMKVTLNLRWAHTLVFPHSHTHTLRLFTALPLHSATSASARRSRWPPEDSGRWLHEQAAGPRHPSSSCGGKEEHQSDINTAVLLWKGDFVCVCVGITKKQWYQLRDKVETEELQLLFFSTWSRCVFKYRGKIGYKFPTVEERSKENFIKYCMSGGSLDH